MSEGARSESLVMRIIIVAWGCEFALEIDTHESVLQIKQKIEQLLHVPVNAQVLAVSGWELVDGLDMDDYPIITEGTRIDLTIRSFEIHSKIKIVVKFSARRINVEVDRNETVHSLKEKIHILDGIPIRRISLFFNGRELEDDFRYLFEYGVGQFSEIVVFLKNINRQRDEIPTRKISLVVQTSSCLLNSASIPVEMNDSSTVNELRLALLGNKILPQDDYIFIHKQRIMRDSCSLRWHGVENGDCLYVFRGTVTWSE